MLGSLAGTFTGTFSVDPGGTASDDAVITITQPLALAGVTGQEHFEMVIVESGRHLLGHGTAPAQDGVEQAEAFRL